MSKLNNGVFVWRDRARIGKPFRQVVLSRCGGREDISLPAETFEAIRLAAFDNGVSPPRFLDWLINSGIDRAEGKV